MPDRRSSNDTEKRFVCEHPGCGKVRGSAYKSYSRLDRLLRHQLNHDESRALVCHQCNRVYVGHSDQILSPGPPNASF